MGEPDMAEEGGPNLDITRNGSRVPETGGSAYLIPSPPLEVVRDDELAVLNRIMSRYVPCIQEQLSRLLIAYGFDAMGTFAKFYRSYWINPIYVHDLSPEPVATATISWKNQMQLLQHIGFLEGRKNAFKTRVWDQFKKHFREQLLNHLRPSTERWWFRVSLFSFKRRLPCLTTFWFVTWLGSFLKQSFKESFGVLYDESFDESARTLVQSMLQSLPLSSCNSSAESVLRASWKSLAACEEAFEEFSLSLEGKIDQLRDAIDESLDVLFQALPKHSPNGATELQSNDVDALHSESSRNSAPVPGEAHSRISSRRTLPLEIEGKLYNTVPDTGSVENIMSEEFARSIGLDLREHRAPERYHNACGSEFISRWTTSVQYAFPGEATSAGACNFAVVSGLSVPLILGSRFLELTHTLTKFKHRLVKVANKTLKRWRILHAALPRRQLRCLINGSSALANADTGSDIDLVSLDFVQKKGLRIVHVPRRHRDVELADGTVIQLVGQVRCKFGLGDDDGGGGTKFRDFYVLPGLTTDVLLGDGTLDELNAFELHVSNFMEVEDLLRSVDLIYWIGREGWPTLDLMIDDARNGVLGNASVTRQSSVGKFAKRLGLKTEKKIWRAADILGNEGRYQDYLEKVINRNEREQDLFERKLSNLSGQERTDAEKEEHDRLQLFQMNMMELATFHEARKRERQALSIAVV